MLRKTAFVMVSLCLLAPLLQAAEVYEWRDAEGEVHMSDTPPPPDQPGTRLLRVNGNDVNTFSLPQGADSTGSRMSDAATNEPAAASPASIPLTEEDCAEIHGRACTWDEDWSGYAQANCARVGDPNCDDARHVRAFYDPRTQSAPGATHTAAQHR